MLETRSALHTVLRPGQYGPARPGGPGVTLSEIRGRSILQVAGWPGTFDAVAARITDLTGCPVARAHGTAGSRNGLTAIHVGAERLWLVGETPARGDRLTGAFDAGDAVALDLSQSRTIIAVEGPAVRRVLAKGVPVDLHADVFATGATAQTVVDHVGVLIHRVGAEAFEIYVPRSYAGSFWHWLTESAVEFGYEIRG